MSAVLTGGEPPTICFARLSIATTNRRARFLQRLLLEQSKMVGVVLSLRAENETTHLGTWRTVFVAIAQSTATMPNPPAWIRQIHRRQRLASDVWPTKSAPKGVFRANTGRIRVRDQKTVARVHTARRLLRAFVLEAKAERRKLVRPETCRAANLGIAPRGNPPASAPFRNAGGHQFKCVGDSDSAKGEATRAAQIGFNFRATGSERRAAMGLGRSGEDRGYFDLFAAFILRRPQLFVRIPLSLKALTVFRVLHVTTIKAVYIFRYYGRFMNKQEHLAHRISSER